MEIVYFATAFSLFAFMVLATYDGCYLHLWKYRLYAQEESKFEHLTHTIRAILFPLIVFFLLLNQGNFLLFTVGIVLSILDFVVLALDANSEQDSRKFMGGLPKSEYVLHLFSNAFHYGVVILAVVINLRFTDNGVTFSNQVNFSGMAGTILTFVAQNAIPGAVLLAILHVLLSFNPTRHLIDNQRLKIKCC